MPDVLFGHFSGDSLSCLLSGFVVIEADVHLLDVGTVLQHLPQNLVRNAAGCRVALAFPAVLEHGNKGQHTLICMGKLFTLSNKEASQIQAEATNADVCKAEERPLPPLRLGSF